MRITRRYMWPGVAFVAVVVAPTVFAAPIPVISPSGQLGDSFGHSAVGVGDVNGDLAPDFAVGAPDEDTPTVASAGRAYLFNGKNGMLLRALTSPNLSPQGNFGFALAATPDMDNDGVNDVAVGAPGERIDGEALGRVHLYSGATGARIRTFNALDAGILQGRSFEYGTSVAFYGDANGDAIPDFVVGAPGWSILPLGTGSGFRTPGRAFLVDGKDGSRIQEFVAPVLEIEGAFGTAVGAIGDVNADGVPDVIVGAPTDRQGQVVAGKAYGFSGATGQQLYSMSSLNPIEGGRFGAHVARIEDLNGDGLDDIVVSADNERSGALQSVGRVYIFSGATGANILTINSPEPNGLMFFGNALDVVGDFNGDGLDDILVVAGSGTRFKQQPPTLPLKAFIVSSVSGAVVHRLTIAGTVGAPLLGSSAAGVGDVDGDGKEDMVVGSTFSQGSVVARAFLFRSRDFAAVLPPPSIDCSGGTRANSGGRYTDVIALAITMLLLWHGKPLSSSTDTRRTSTRLHNC